MKNIINIFKRDMKNIFTNWVAALVVVVLMIIPSLYSLINIEASWDPYSNTKGIEVAIVNEDKGTVYKEHSINLGDELVDKLKENDQLGWVFVDKETAKNGLTNEKYYAMIEIPQDFSEDVTTVVKKDVTKPKLIYTVNEKKNVIASKITDAGVKSVKTQLDENIAKSISGIMFRLCDEVGIDIQNNRSELRNIIDSVYKLDDNMPEIEKMLDEAINGTISASELMIKTNELIPTAADTVDETAEFLNNTQSFLNETQGDLQNESPKIKEDLVECENTLDIIGTELKNIDENISPEVEKKALLQILDTSKAIRTSSSDAKSRLKNIKRAIDKISEIEIPKPSIDKSLQSYDEIKKLQQIFDKQADVIENQRDLLKQESRTISKIIDRLDNIDNNLDKLIDRTNKDIDKLNNGDKILDMQDLTDTRKVLDDLHNLVSDITDNYDSEIVPTINKGFDSMSEIIDTGLNLSAQGKKTLPDVQEMLNTFKNAEDLSNDELKN